MALVRRNARAGALATEMPTRAQGKMENRSALRSGAHTSEGVSTEGQVGAGPQRDTDRSHAGQHDPHVLAILSAGPSGVFVICSLHGNGIGPKGAEALGKALEMNGSLRKLKCAQPRPAACSLNE